MSNMVLPSGPIPARIMIVGEAPGSEEERLGHPFVGASGNELTRMLTEAGINRNECFITNVIRIRPPNNDLGAFIAFKKKDITPSHIHLRDRMVMRCVEEGYLLLLKEIALCNPNLIIALGNCALWALTGRWGITDWRGSTLVSDVAIRASSGVGYKVLCTYHPAAVLRQWSWRSTLVADLRRAAREVTTEALESPPFDFKIRPSLRTYLDFVEHLGTKVERVGLFELLETPGFGPPARGRLKGTVKLSVDIETRLHHITCIGIAWSKTEAICIPFTTEDGDGNYWTEDEEALIVFHLYKLLTDPRVEVIGQNFIYDAQHILRWWHFIPRFKFDTMLAQHTMFPGTPKALDYLASLYCTHYAQWKGDARDLWKDHEEKKDA